MPGEPKLHVIEPPAAAARWREEHQRRAAEGRRRYLARLEALFEQLDLDPGRAGAVLDDLFTVVPAEGGEPCSCACHPQLPDGDLHDYGFGCVCQRTAEERRRSWDRWLAERDDFWASPEGRSERARKDAEEEELASWLEGETEVIVTSHGGAAPEQWWGRVDGRSFYFRERHDHWRIELDLRPSGRTSKVYDGGDLDDEASFHVEELEVGDVIAEGVAGAPGYGTSPLGRARFVVGTIRRHLRQGSCGVHPQGRAALEDLTGIEISWCPACGVAVDG